MLCYKDMTFCLKSRADQENQCLNVECERYVTSKVLEDAQDFGLGLALADLSTDCSSYNPSNLD